MRFSCLVITTLNREVLRWQGEEEIITILSGHAAYDDNGTIVALEAGDTCVCKSGESHSIANASPKENLILFAVINYLA